MAKYTTYYLFLSVLLCIYSVSASKERFVVLKGTDNYKEETIDQNNVADLLAHISGLNSLHENIERSAFPEVDYFNLPKANLLVVVDAVSEDFITQMTEKYFFDTTGAIEIIKQKSPEDSISFLTSILSGESWDSHGIIGNSWKATDYLSVTAFAHGGQCKVPRLADIISHSSNGLARTLVFSSNNKMAHAMGVHSELQQTHSDWNNRIYAYNTKHGITDILNDRMMASNPTIRSAAQTKGIRIETSEGFILASELYAIENIPSFLNEMKVGEGGDFIGIGISSIKALTTKHGADSEQVRVALSLLDQALTNLSEKLNEMYDSQVATQIIGLGSSTAEHTVKTQKHQIRKYLADGDGDGTNTSNQYSLDQVSAFQTQFWVAIYLIIAVIIALAYLIKMDKLYDSLLYKTTDGPRPIPDVK